VLAIWPANNNDLAAATRQAARCALTATHELQGFALVDDVTLVHRAAVGAGPISYFEVGGEHGRWQPLLAGDAIAQLGPTRKLARAGEVLASPEAWRQIADAARGEVFEYGEARIDEITRPADATQALEIPAADDALVQAYVPDVVLQRLQAGHGEWLAEFRPVVVVFIYIAGVEYRTAGTLDRLQNVMLAVQRPLEHHHGAIYQFLMDDKGTSLIAAFGLPHHAQEHEARRAVNAALAIHESLSAMAVRASIGIASGRAFCGSYGNALRRQYTIVGPVINLASRLAQHAAGGILCDEPTQKHAQQRIHFTALPAVPIKGRAEPVAVFRPDGRVEVGSGETTIFVGREAERALLHQRIDDLATGRGGLIGIIGEAGIGKSYLLREAVQHARSRNVHVVSSAGDALERSTIYFAWRELLPLIADVRTTLLQWLHTEPALWPFAPLLNAIVPLGLDDNEVTRSMASEARTDMIQSIMARLIDHQVQQQPIILVLDDMHWLDSASMTLALSVAQRVNQVLIVFATRPLDERSPAGLRRALNWPSGDMLHLEPLSSGDAGALIAQRLGVSSIPDELVTFVQQRADGHPFYTEELTMALRERGLIVVTDDVVKVAGELGGSDFPDTVHDVVNSRIDALQPVEQLTLKTASVIGRAFPYSVLVDVYPVEPDRPQLPAALNAIERADLAHMETPEPNRSYLFRHAITQEAAYSTLLFSQRRQLHERIARWYETHERTNPASYYALLAYHWERAEVADKAIEYLEKAGIDAFNAFSSQECVQFFQRAQKIAGTNPQLVDVHRRAEWERYLGDAHQHMTDYQRSEIHLRKSLELVGRKFPQSRLALAGALGLETLRQVLHRLVPGWFMDKATGHKHHDLVNATVVYRAFTEITFFRSDSLGVLYSAMAVLNCGERTGKFGKAAMGAGAIAFVFSILGMRRFGDFYINLGVNYAEREGNISEIAYVAGIQRTLVSIAKPDWEAAEAASLRGLEGFARAGYRVRWELLGAGYGIALLIWGRIADAKPIFDEVYTSAHGSRPQTMRLSRIGQLGVGLLTGEFNAELVRDLEQLVSDAPPLTEVVAAWGLIAQAHLRSGDVSSAWHALEAGLKLNTDYPPATY
ncbi:MAG TPA: BREX system ATP-binding domain-containing protein, partial [Lysobacter sp.]|nr:BREX system ATP-binding domain-containing protein [Lysobacter sp.]